MNASQGGITSVKSHGKAFGNDPIQSKAHSEIDDDPADPGDLEDDHNNYAVLDLNEYYNKNINAQSPGKTSGERVPENTRFGEIRRPVTQLNSHSYIPLSDNENL